MRLLVMALWVPKVVIFVARLKGLADRLSIPECLAAITPQRTSRLPHLTPEETARVIWNVLRWKRGPFNHGCFVRSFTRYRLLREMGLPSVFHLGVESKEKAAAHGDAPEPGPFSHLRGHAWVSLNGEPFLEVDPELCRSYREVYRFPASEA